MRSSAWFACSIACLISFAISAQSPAPRFEVVSVKPSRPDPAFTTSPATIDPSRVIYSRLPAKILIQIAYKLNDWAISGGPAWLDSDQFDIAATIPPGVSKDQIPAMMQALLEERFQLKIHRETKEMPVFALTIAKGGSKLKPGEEGDQWVGGTMKGGIFKGRLELHQCSMGSLAATLANKTGRPVIDRTNLTGMFDVILKWTPEDAADGNTPGPSLYTALQEQLGLKLDSTRAPVDIFVITHIEKPTDN